jgi:hypothetical protein
MSEVGGQDKDHQECSGELRYLDAESGDYIEENCGCACHQEKREWYLSDFGPGPHQILWINDKYPR